MKHQPRSAFPTVFLNMVAARFLLTFAVQLQATSMGVHLYQQNRDIMQLGLIGLLEAIPALSLALLAGAWVDRNSSSAVFKKVIWGSGLSILVSALASKFPQSTFPILGIAALITGLARAFYGPSIQTIVPNLVTRDLISRASAWMTFANRTGMVMGPLVAGFLLHSSADHATHQLPFLISQVVAFTAILLASLCSLRLPHLNPQSTQNHEPILQSLNKGLLFVLNHPILFPALALDMFAVLFGGMTAILPAFAEDILLVDGTGLGLLRASPALGAMLMGFVLTRFPPSRNTGRILFQVMTGYGLCIVFFAMSKSLWPALVFLFLSGVFDSVNMVIRNALVQLTSPEEYRGRIASVNSMFIGSSNEIGAFESGLAAKWMGLVPSLYFGGTMTLLVVISIYLRFKELRRVSIYQLEKAPNGKA